MSTLLKSMWGDVNMHWLESDSDLQHPSFYVLVPMTGIRLKSGFKQCMFWIQSRWEGKWVRGDFCMRNVWRRKVVFKWWRCVWGGGGAGWSDESKVVLTLRDLIPVTLKPQRDNDITPSFQDRESKRCRAGPSLYTQRTHTCYYKTIRPHF